MIHTLGWLYWNPERVVFTVPILERPIVWYGLWFVFGFIVGYFLLINLFQQKISNKKESRQVASFLVDRLTWFVVGGTIIGARLGHVFFYDWPRYKNHLIDIIKIWEGGLASHGGTIGVILGLFFYQRLIRKNFPEFTFINLLDLLIIPSAFVACCIRIGNFFNQEILGMPSSLPWAIIFGDPSDGGAIIPRHPVQLYEAAFYLLTFFILYYVRNTKAFDIPGRLVGLGFILIFGFRFFIEFLKMPQSLMINESFLQTGQYLSLPFVAAGLLLLFRNGRTTKENVA